MKTSQDVSTPGWYERVILRRALLVPPDAWTEALGMKQPEWWQFWKMRMWVRRVEGAKRDIKQLLAELSAARR